MAEAWQQRGGGGSLVAACYLSKGVRLARIVGLGCPLNRNYLAKQVGRRDSANRKINELILLLKVILTRLKMKPTHARLILGVSKKRLWRF